MPNLMHFMIPADDVDRAKRFYAVLLGWQIEPISIPRDHGGMSGDAVSRYHHRAGCG